MAKPAKAAIVSDRDVIAMLDRYHCPAPFHIVRTRFLGNIATPGQQVSPMDMVKALWGGELPSFDNLDAVNELLGTLVMGLWNQLTNHQERSAPFRLSRLEVAPTREDLAEMALLRRQEIDGFVDGLFGPAAELDLPNRAHRALDALAGARALLEAAQEVALDLNKPAKPIDLADTLRHLRELSRIAEHEIHEAVLACARARRQFLEMWPASRSTVH